MKSLILTFLFLYSFFEIYKTSTPTEFLMCLHAGPPLDKSFEIQSMSYVKELGASGVRTDVCWSLIEPIQGKYDMQAIEFYKNYFQLYSDNNMRSSMIILSSVPEWAKDLFQKGDSNSKSIFYKAWADYIEIVVTQIGIPLNIKHYQLWNEPNAIPSFSFWSDIPQIIKSGGKKLKELVPNAIVYVNPNCNMIFWADILTDWCLKAGEFFSGIGVDHYPGTWSSTGWQDWSPLNIVINRTNNKNDPCYGKKPALLETGYSSFSEILNHGENRQKQWVEQSFPSALNIIKKNKNSLFSIDLIAFYELYDEGDYNTFPPEEAHFGVIGKNSKKKMVFESLKDFVAEINL